MILRSPFRKRNWRAFPHIMFTLPGILVTIASVAMGLDLLSSPTALKRLTTGFLLGILVIDMVWSIRQARRIKLSDVLPERTRSDEPACVCVSLRNDSRGDALLRLTLDFRDQPPSWMWLLAHKEGGVNVHSGQRLKRGVHVAPDILCELQSPLRLFSTRWVPTLVPRDEPAEPVVVWPAPWNGLRHPLPGIATDQGHEDSEAPIPTPDDGAKVQIDPGSHGWLREWRRGDRLAHIAHKASAHRDQLLVQTASASDEPELGEVFLTLAWAREMVGGQTEAALSLLGSTAEQALKQRRRVGVALDSRLIPAGRGEEQRHRILDALARFTEALA